MDGLVVDLHDVAKTYRRRVHALQGIDVRIPPGEIFGLLGPNGAGKSTLVKILMTVIRPTRAAGTVLGQPLGHKPALAKVGYLPEHHRFPPYLTGRQALEFFAALAKVDRAARKRRAAELLEVVGLAKWADAKVGAYSKGMQQRLALAQALMNQPQLIVLDEPTDGLDPVGRREVRDVLAQLRAQGKSILLNSHLLSEVERVCDRVAILVGGRVIRRGTIDELTLGSQRYEIELTGPQGEDLRASIRAALPCELAICLSPSLDVTPFVGEKGDSPHLPERPEGCLAQMGTVPFFPPMESGKLPSGEIVELAGTTVRVVTADAARIQPLIDAFRGRGLVISAVRLVRQSLEDFFIQAVAADSALAGNGDGHAAKGVPA